MDEPDVDAETYGAWTDVVAGVTKMALAATQVPGLDGAVEVIKALIGVEGGQDALMKAIKRDTALLRAGPHRTAKIRLAEAARVGPGSNAYAGHLLACKDGLYTALGLTGAPEEKSVVEYELALLYRLLGETGNADHWIRMSYGHADEVVDRYAAHLSPRLKYRHLADVAPTLIGKVTVLLDERTGLYQAKPSRWSALMKRGGVREAAYMTIVPVTMVYGLPAVAWLDGAALPKLARTLSKLRQYLALYNTLATLNSQLTGRPSPLLAVSRLTPAQVHARDEDLERQAATGVQVYRLAPIGPK